MSDGTCSDCDDGECHPSKRTKQAGIADRPSLSSYSNAAPLGTPYLSLLPVELVDRIYTHLSDHIEVTFLALTSRRYWQVGRRHIKFRFECLSNWAGDRLICIGNYSEDFPPGLLTAAEETELRKGYTWAEKLEYFDNESEESDEDDGKTRRLNLYDVAVNRFTPRFHTDEVKWAVHYELLYKPHYTTAGQNDGDLFLSLTDPSRAWKRHGVRLQTCEPEPIGLRKRWNVRVRRPQAERAEHWAVLRNLSRREYVHGKAIQELRERNYLDDSHWVTNNLDSFGFGDLIAFRSFWSQTDMSSPFAWDWDRGIWAGHRFDIVLEQDLKKAMENEQWKDVSEEAIAEVMEVFQRNSL